MLAATDVINRIMAKKNGRMIFTIIVHLCRSIYSMLSWVREDVHIHVYMPMSAYLPKYA